MIASLFYDQPQYWWFLGQINNILDPVTEVVEGLRLYIPTKDRLFLMLTGKQGGINSTREKNIFIISPLVL